MSTNMKETGRVRVKKRLDYRSLPLQLFESGLSSEAKVLLGWVLMHQNDWETHIGHALRTTRIPESTWKRRVRKELISAGFFSQLKERVTGKSGREVLGWVNTFTDEPFLWCQNEPVENEPVRSVQVQNDRVYKTKNLQKHDLTKSLKKQPLPVVVGGGGIFGKFYDLLPGSVRHAFEARASDLQADISGASEEQARLAAGIIVDALNRGGVKDQIAFARGILRKAARGDLAAPVQAGIPAAENTAAIEGRAKGMIGKQFVGKVNQTAKTKSLFVFRDAGIEVWKDDLVMVTTPFPRAADIIEAIDAGRLVEETEENNALGAAA